ncbi:AraC family transcriptional regulator [Rosettibacter firmus]|uniref:AraC family transcriptional regulator n=1 Tax=Rosettibacter firmus TaxID=3111522 RepID=UPI00336C0422
MESKNKTNILYIKNMVCNRCIKVVKEELEKAGIEIKNITLGEVELTKPIDQKKLNEIKKALEANGFEILENRKAKIVEKIKNTVISIIYQNDELLTSNKNFSSLIEEKIGMDYNYLSYIFSSLESITIEQFIILQKIERAKELLKYDELTLSEIAYKLGYKSVQHLSSQFKKVTGFSASEFKKNLLNLRKPIDKVISL